MVNAENEEFVQDYYQRLYSPACGAAMARCLAPEYVEHQ